MGQNDCIKQFFIFAIIEFITKFVTVRFYINLMFFGKKLYQVFGVIHNIFFTVAQYKYTGVVHLRIIYPRIFVSESIKDDCRTVFAVKSERENIIHVSADIFKLPAVSALFPNLIKVVYYGFVRVDNAKFVLNQCKYSRADYPHK